MGNGHGQKIDFLIWRSVAHLLHSTILMFVKHHPLGIGQARRTILGIFSTVMEPKQTLIEYTAHYIVSLAFLGVLLFQQSLISHNDQFCQCCLLSRGPPETDLVKISHRLRNVHNMRRACLIGLLKILLMRGLAATNRTLAWHILNKMKTIQTAYKKSSMNKICSITISLKSNSCIPTYWPLHDLKVSSKISKRFN